MAPIPLADIDAAATTLHRISRRDAEQGRIAGMLVGCLLAAVLAVGIIYFCFNCHFSSEKPEKKTEKGHVHRPETHHHHVHPKQHRHSHRHSIHAQPMEVPPAFHAHHAHHAPAPHGHRWTHHHHRHAHHHHQHQKNKKTKAKARPKPKSSKNKRKSTRSAGDGSTTVRFMPMPPMEMPDGGMGMPIPPAPVAGMGMGMGMGIGIGMGMPGDDFIDYGPGPGLQDDPGLEVGWGLHPAFPLARFAEEDDPDGDREASCNECCYSFFDALCGVEPASRNLRREAAGDGPIPLGDNEMAGH